MWSVVFRVYKFLWRDDKHAMRKGRQQGRTQKVSRRQGQAGDKGREQTRRERRNEGNNKDRSEEERNIKNDISKA